MVTSAMYQTASTDLGFTPDVYKVYQLPSGGPLRVLAQSDIAVVDVEGGVYCLATIVYTQRRPRNHQ